MNGAIDLTGDSPPSPKTGPPRKRPRPWKQEPPKSGRDAAGAQSLEIVHVQPAEPPQPGPAANPAAAATSSLGANAAQAAPAAPASAPCEIAALERELREATAEVTALQQALARAKRARASAARRLSRARDVRAAAADRGLDWTRARAWDAELRRVCRETLGAPSFRPLQREALNATLARRDVFAVLPTGAGKSLLYQAAALVDGGLTLVVSPLLALSEDQRARLAARGVRAHALDSNTSREDARRALDAAFPPRAAAAGATRQALRKRLRAGDALAGAGAGAAPWARLEGPATILFVTPERVARSKRLMSRLEAAYEAGQLARIAVDEAHCCAQWGHDFRPDFAKLGVLRRQLPETPVLLLSATAAPRVVEEVKKIVGAPQCVVFRASVDRRNLHYAVRALAPGETAAAAAADLAKSRFPAQCGIVYVLSRKDAESVAAALRAAGVAAAGYHASMEQPDRARVQEDWMAGRVRVVVATVAFGLGIDNQAVRFVVHACIPPSLEAYYQESGRAGRDGQPAQCVALFQASDFARMSSFVADKGPARLELLYEMAKYALGLGVCRRDMLARAFGERAPRRSGADKNTCCDMCAEDVGDVEMLDVSREAKVLLRIMGYASETFQDDKITITRLAAESGNTGPKGIRFRGPDIKPLSRVFDKETRLLMVIVLIIHGALREYHNYNLYSLNGYVALGAASQIVLDGNLTIAIPVQTKLAEKIRKARAQPR